MKVITRFGCLGFLGIITFGILTALKLCNVLPWSWAWVLAPVWFVAILEFMASLTVLVVRVIHDIKEIPDKKGK